MINKATKLLIVCLLVSCIVGCSRKDEEKSNFSANIDKCYQENGVDEIMTMSGNSKQDLKDLSDTMHSMYGENLEITDEYDKNLSIKTDNGTYVGKIVSDDVISWKGIPYAKQPVGDLRWRAPQEPDASDSVYEAYYFGHSPLQAIGNNEPASLYPQGEDCLNLNIWNNTLDASSNKPIMVWIYGGAYVQGGASTDIYDGTGFVLNHPDVIYVSIDYRTDFMGFINLSNVEGAEDYTDSANLGLLDQMQAIKWLKQNAKAFGGDPDRITIFGESAGAGSVSALTLAPQAKGLFKRAIMQSGIASGFLRSKEKSIEHTNKIMEITGAKNIDDLLSLSESDIRKLENIFHYALTNYTIYPQCDDIVIPVDIKEALKSNRRNGIDIMVGTNKDEYNFWTMVLGQEANMVAMQKSEESMLEKMDDDQKTRYKEFMDMQDGDEYNKLLQSINYLGFHSPTRNEANTHIANGQNAYVYYFTEESTDLLASHCYDLGFVLGNVEVDRVKDLDSAKRLSAIMQQMWVNFAINGDPSLLDGQVEDIGSIKWNTYEPDNYPVMIFDSLNVRQESDPIKNQNDLIEDLYWLRIDN